jgi:hypothetical protein
MERTTDKLKKDILDGVAALKRARDEVKVDLHLAGMDAREEWKKLEARLQRLDQDAGGAAAEFSDRTKQSLEEVSKAFKRFRDTLKSAVKDKPS